MASSSDEFHGTVKPVANLDAEKDAGVLRKAMKGLGTDESAIINLLSQRSNAQRLEIKKKFKVLYGKSLEDDLESELSGNFKKTVLALIEDRAVFEAEWLHKAMKGLGTDEALLIEILASRTNAEIHNIKEAFKKKYGKDLEKEIKSDTSGHFERLLVSLCQGARDESTAVDAAKAAADAKALYNAGEKRWGTDESKFNQILVSRSFPQLRATFKEYQKIAKRDIISSIKREMSGDVEDGMISVVMCAQDRPAFFAEKLYKTMKGAGTDDDGLIRIVVTRCEVEMVEIKQAFSRLYKKSLESFIKDDTSGDYEKMLLALIK